MKNNAGKDKHWEDYVKKVRKDINELLDKYPFTREIIIPTVTPSPIMLEIIAVEKEVINELMANENDFIDEYSKKIIVEIPKNYPKSHCIITGGKWIVADKIKQEERHFYDRGNKGFEFCVGVPSSVKKMKNVLLENVMTVDNLLTGYEMLQRNISTRLNVRAYSHGNEGEKEFEKEVWGKNNEKNRK